MEEKFAHIPDRLWKLIAPLLPVPAARPRGGRPRIPDRQVWAGIIYRLIRRRGEPPLMGCVRGKPRRWVVERTNAWHNRFRGLLIRWERRGELYQGLLDLACGLIAFAQAVR
jgi:transposase